MRKFAQRLLKNLDFIGKIEQKLEASGATLIVGPKDAGKPRLRNKRKDGVYVLPIGCLKD